MQNKVIRQTSKWDNFVAERSRFLNQKSNKKTGWTRLILNFSYSKLKLLQSMLPYFLKSKQNTQNMNPKALKTSNCQTMLSSKCAVCGSKNQDLWNKKKSKKYYVIYL